MIQRFFHYLDLFPEYALAAKAAVFVLIAAPPLYLALWYFLYRRSLKFPVRLQAAFFGVFGLITGLAYLLASPLAKHLPTTLVQGYLFLTCIMAAYLIVALLDIFLIGHYLITVRRLYISPPLRKIIGIAVFCLAFLPILRFVLNFNPLALVAIPTIMTAGIALALQDTLKTFIAGVALGSLIRVGDWISFQDKEGRVIDINWARTVLSTVDGDLLFIPNSQLQTQSFVNYTSGNARHRKLFKVGVSYSAPPSRVKQVMLRCAQNIKGLCDDPAPVVQVLEFGDSAVTYLLIYWVEDYTHQWNVQDDLATRVWYAFRREGMEIPFPARVIYNASKKTEQEPSLEQKIQALQHWELARALSPDDLKQIAQGAECRVYSPGDVVVKQGEAGQSLFLILAGSVEVVQEVASGAMPVAVLREKDVFGEWSLLTGELRRATVRAREETEVLEIEKAGLQPVLLKQPSLADRLAELLAQRQSVLAGLKKNEEQAAAASTPQKQSIAARMRQFFGL